MTPWYVSVICALIGVAGGFGIRAWFDSRAERLWDYREVFKNYLTLTDVTSDDSQNYKLWALIRSGALRLKKKDFQRLLGDAAIAGRGIEIDDFPSTEEFTLRACLIYSVATGVSIHRDTDILEAIIKAAVMAADQGVKLDTKGQERLLRSIAGKAENHTTNPKKKKDA